MRFLLLSISLCLIGCSGGGGSAPAVLGDIGNAGGDSGDTNGSADGNTAPTEGPSDNNNTSANANSPLGMNLSELSYYSAEWVFTDAMKQSSPWLPQDIPGNVWNTGVPLTLDSDGWPLLKTGEAAGTLMYRDIGGHYPAGQYTCLYEGEGMIWFGFDATIVSQTPGRIVVNVATPTISGIYLKILSSKSTNHIRNIRLMLPGFENTTDTFHPLFLQRLASFKVLRFMDWQRTNGSKNKDWSARNTKSSQTQADDRGVALDYMIELCNKLGADMYVNIPHLATNDYVTQFATMVRDQLDPALKIYIEHSNEIWNGVFGGADGQFQYCIDKGVALGLEPSNQWLAGYRYHSQRSVEIFNIFQSVFGGTSRMVRVLGSFVAVPWVGQQIMDWKNAYQSADALAIAPYFGGVLDSDAGVTNMTTAQILSACSADILNAINGLISDNASAASTRGLKLLAYEGGQHLVGFGPNFDNATATNKFIEANRDPGMYDLYMQSLNGWKQNGGGMFLAYASCTAPSKYGSWGALEYQDQSPSLATTPKYKALSDYIQQEQAAAGTQ